MDVDDALAVHIEDRVIGYLIGKSRLVVPQERLVLGFPLFRKRLNELPNKTGQVPLGV